LGEALRAGESWALAETWRRFAPLVFPLAARTLGSDAEGEDATQEVFYRLYQKARTLRDPSTLRSFVFSFAIRVLKTELRKRKARRWLHFYQPDELPEPAASTIDVEAKDLLQRFYRILNRLGARDRLVFTLRHVERMTVEEVALAMGLSPSTVKRSLTHATAKVGLWVEGDLGMHVPEWRGT